MSFFGQVARRWLSKARGRSKRQGAAPLRVRSFEDRIVPTLMGNQLFPADNPWNEKITNAPVAANSNTLVNSIGASSPLHPDFGAGLYGGSDIGIPYNVVPGTQPKVNVVIDAYADESDVQPIPIPANAVIEGDPAPSGQNTSDRHLLVYDQDNNIVYETFNTHRPSEEPDGRWHADAEAVWNLNTDTFRTAGYTSADAAGLPILPGLVRPDEVLTQGKITHALRFTVPGTDSAYVFPASHVAGVNNPALPRMGERFRLKQNVDISGFSAADQVILQALKDYGMIVADNGSPWYLSGVPSGLWDNNDLHALTTIPGSDFEAVDLTPVVSGVTPNGGGTAGGIAVTVSGVNFSGGAGLTKVFFGSTAATGVTVLSDRQIMATAPALGAGTVDVTVQSPYGTSAVVTGDRFTYAGTSNQPWLTAVYEALLHRPVDPSGLQTYTDQLNSGTARSTVVGEIEGGPEYLVVRVQNAYTRYLHRTADAGGLGLYKALLQNGGTDEQLDATLVGSSEFFSRPDLGGGTTTGFLKALYMAALGRPLDSSGQATYKRQLADGAGTGQVAAEVITSAEGLSFEINDFYQEFLGRAADGGGLATYLNVLHNGGTDEQVIADLLGSDEYFNANT